MIQLEENIKWKQLLFCIISLSTIISLITWRYLHKKIVFETSIPIKVEVIGVNCSSNYRIRSHVSFLYEGKRNFANIKNSECKTLLFGDSITAIYDKKWGVFYTSYDLRDEETGLGLWIAFLVVVIMLYLFKIDFQKVKATGTNNATIKINSGN